MCAPVAEQQAAECEELRLLYEACTQHSELIYR